MNNKCTLIITGTFLCISTIQFEYLYWSAFCKKNWTNKFSGKFSRKFEKYSFCKVCAKAKQKKLSWRQILSQSTQNLGKIFIVLCIIMLYCANLFQDIYFFFIQVSTRVASGISNAIPTKMSQNIDTDVCKKVHFVFSCFFNVLTRSVFLISFLCGSTIWFHVIIIIDINFLSRHCERLIVLKRVTENQNE